jgi:PAS domain S-box-containing protein
MNTRTEPTHLRHTQGKLQQSEELFQSLVNAVKDYAIFMLNPSGFIQTWNAGAERIKGYKAHEIIGKHFSIFYSDTDINRGHPEKELIIAQAEGRFEEEGWRIRKNGTQFLANVVITALYDEEGELRGFSKVTRDITERKTAEEAILKSNLQLRLLNATLEEKVKERTNAITQTNTELIKYNTQLKRFAYVASHDLMEPLRMISSYIELTQKRLEGKLDSETQKYLNFAIEGANRMAALTHDLLAYSKITNQADIYTDVDCNGVCDEALLNLQILIKNTGAVVSKGPLPVILANPGNLIQVFQNLIGNALKFISQTSSPEVSISAIPNDLGWLFRVKDNGIGISPNDKDKIFEVFKRLHSREEYPGTGIGLAVCKQIVENLGGKIWVESELGQGSSFFFILPKKPEKK